MNSMWIRAKKHNTDFIKITVLTLILVFSFSGHAKAGQVSLGQISELGYHIPAFGQYAGYLNYGDLLIVENDVYKKEGNVYRRQPEILEDILGTEVKGLEQCIQYNNLLIKTDRENSLFLLYDMETEPLEVQSYQCVSQMQMWWYVHGDYIYYLGLIGHTGDRERLTEKNMIRRISLITGEDSEVYQPHDDEGCINKFMIRDDGTIICQITDTERDKDEYWLLRPKEKDRWEEKKIWEKDNGSIWEFEWWEDFNENGLVIDGQYYCIMDKDGISTLFERVILKENGERVRLDISLGDKEWGIEDVFCNDGFFVANCVPDMYVPAEYDLRSRRNLRGKPIESVSFYDYEGNLVETYQLLERSMLDQGYYLRKYIYDKGRILGFFLNENTGELYITETGTERVATESGQEEIKFPAVQTDCIADLKEIPESGYHFSPLAPNAVYVCYGDLLVIRSTVYRKQGDKYLKQKETLEDILGIEFPKVLERCIQYKNLLITTNNDRTAFQIYDMEQNFQKTGSYECGNIVNGAWYIHGDFIYYLTVSPEHIQTYKTIQKWSIRRINLQTGEDTEVYRLRDQGYRNRKIEEFRIRDDGSIFCRIRHQGEYMEEYCVLTWKWGRWEKDRIGERSGLYTDEVEYCMDFNQSGAVMYRSEGKSRWGREVPDEMAMIRTGGVITRPDAQRDDRRLEQGYVFRDDGFFVGNIIPEMAENTGIYGAVDSVSLYDYDGNLMETYPLIDQDMLEQGYYLQEFICDGGRMLAFYVHERTDELYIVEIQTGR